MKYTYLLICLLFIGSLLNSVLAQDQDKQNAQQKDKVIISANSVTDPVLNDPKLSVEEIDLLRTAGQDNPSKIEEGLNDPKMKASEIPDEASFGSNNAKAEPIVEREEVKAVELTNTAASVSTYTQPEGEKPENKTSYSKKNTGQNPGVQPEGNKPAKKVIYIKKSGTNSQPEGNKPSGK